jgi:hypothetical protein
VDYNDYLDYEEYYPDYTSDPTFVACKDTLTRFFRRKLTPYYLTEVEVLLEKQYFHWITYRAIKSLVSDGYLTEHPVTTKYGSPVIFVARSTPQSTERGQITLTHIKSKVKLIETISKPEFTDVIGKHLQFLVKSELRANFFTIEAENSNEYRGKKWTRTGHDLDFIATHERGFAIGVEVKNTSPYIPREEFDIKLEMCMYLGLKPVFAVRWMPKSYIYEAYTNGGFGWLFEYQAYPLGFDAMAERVGRGLSLPVKVMPELPSRAQDIFSNWVKKQR